MPYEITLRPQPNAFHDPSDLRNRLLSLGVQSDGDSSSHDPIFDGFAMIDVVVDPSDQSQVSAIVKLPYCRSLEDAAEEFHLLITVAQALDADLIDGDVLIRPSDASVTTQEGYLALLMQFMESYEKQSKAAAAVLGIGYPQPSQ